MHPHFAYLTASFNLSPRALRIALCRFRPTRSRGLIRGGLVAAALQSLSLVGAQLTVLWNDNSSTELGFRVERSTDGNTFSAITTLPANATTFTDSSVADGTTYWYRVRAFDLLNLSAPSNVTSGTTASTREGTSSSSSASNLTDETTPYTTGSTSPSSSTPPETDSGRIQVFTARAVAGNSSAQPITIDFTIAGGTKALLMRGIAPALSRFTSAKTLPDPSVTVYSGSQLVASNDNWGGGSTLSSVFDQVGAFALSASSNDAALYITAAPGSYTQTVSGNYSGLAQAEIYDADTATVPAGRLATILTRATVGTASGTLIGGFIITGNSSVKLLIRAIGPSLEGDAGALSDPILTVYNGSTQVDQNDNWGGNWTLASAFNLVGASALPSTSADSAMIVTLSPGTYTATVAGVSNTVGTARLEFYQLP